MVKFEQIKGFVFDLDGVIASTSIYHAKAWHQLADELGVTWTDELGDQLKGVSRMDSLELILKAGGKENDYTQEEKVKYATKKNENYVNLLSNLTDDDILPGMKDFIEDLAAHNYLISLASASKNAPKVLEALNLDKYFKERVDPATLKHGKPDPEIYVRGAEILNLKPEECIGVEDAAAGVQSINAANETSIGIGDPEVLKAADINFNDTSEVTLENIKKAMA
ncbi:beta-phosphoglucomutase [Companilactobacillus suantsaicola]|uniref:Beta-phosphoglucomutase n=1 Tax=Companilactobacillus suantsaicola TaxID=2487723 RepID=A0A4Z0JHG5_9LACO|nr:beta-phosphoglucomutase [Companilactobacillus suantsaicola]TGD22240.1 beta-phosphoglucomutase [Companilactobacillus suantsaicola]